MQNLNNSKKVAKVLTNYIQFTEGFPPRQAITRYKKTTGFQELLNKEEDRTRSHSPFPR